MSPPVSVWTVAVARASQSPRCHRAGSGCQQCSGHGEVLHSAAQGYLTGLPCRGSSGTPHIPLLSCPSATCTHRAAKQELQVAPMSLHALWCPCRYYRLFPDPALLPPRPVLSLGDPFGVLSWARVAGQEQEGGECPRRADTSRGCCPWALYPILGM